MRNCPKAQISASDWIDYLEGAMDRSGCARLERHFEACPRCREFRDSLLLGQHQLEDAASRATWLPEAKPSALARIWDGVRFRIRQADRHHRNRGPEQVEQLRSIVASMCGTATAETALREAAVRPGQPFASNLGSMIEVMCGKRAALLVETAAERVDERLVA